MIYRNVIKIIILFTAIVSLQACSSQRVFVGTKNDLNVAQLAKQPLDQYDLKTIRLLYETSNIIDSKNNTVIYPAKYKIIKGIRSSAIEIWYFVLHQKEKESKRDHWEIFVERFNRVKKGNLSWTVRKTYEELLRFCKKVN
jgi:hypothetical protein